MSGAIALKAKDAPSKVLPMTSFISLSRNF